MNSILLSIILFPLALLVIFIMILAFIVGLYIMLAVYRSGRSVDIDDTNYAGRLLGFIQLSRHIPKLMKLVALDKGQTLFIEMAEGKYRLQPLNHDHQNDENTFVLRRPLLRINSQDLMEQLDFRPDDGRVT